MTSSKYTDTYYNHFAKKNSRTPPIFKKGENYMMRFRAPLTEYEFDENNLTIIYFKEGTGQLFLDNKNFKVGSDKFIVINPSQGWKYFNKGGEYIDVLSLVVSNMLLEQFNYFSHANLTKLLDNPFYTKPLKTCFIEHTFGADYYRSGKLLQHIHKLSDGNNYGETSALELSIDILQSLHKDQNKGKAIAAYIEAKKPSTRLEVLQRLLIAKEYIHDNIMKPISLDELSLISALSKYHLYNSFKKVYGKTPHQYINKLKVVKAKEMIRNGQYLLNEISDLLGFNDPTVFGKVFKKIYGYPPSYYQNKR